MSRVKLLFDVAENMRSLADSLQAIADTIGEGDTTTEKTELPEKIATPIAVPQIPTLEEVRAVLATKSRQGHTAKVKELLLKHGAGKLSEIDKADFPALLSEAEEL